MVQAREREVVEVVVKLTEKLNTYKKQNKKICIHLHINHGFVSNRISVGEFKISNHGVYITDKGEDFVIDIENVKSITEDEYDESFFIEGNKDELYVDFI